MYTRPFAAVLFAAACSTAYAQSESPCTVLSSVETPIAVNGESELTGDVVFTCTNGAATIAVPPTILLNIDLVLNTNLTSRLEGASEIMDTVLLLDEPAPAVQAAGTNVFPGTFGLDNQVTWTGIPLPGGTHTYRISNIRANGNIIGTLGDHVIAFLAVNGSGGLTFTDPSIPLGILQTPLEFTTSPIVSAVALISGLNFNFKEGYPVAFRKRIENTAGPLTFQYEDVPGAAYCTQSGFTPKYQPLPSPGEIGLADTGTRLLGSLSDLPGSVFLLIVPNEVTSSSGLLVAHRVLPPFGANHQTGAVLTVGGESLVLVTPSHTAELLYEVTAAAPYAGVNGCGAVDEISIPVVPFLPNSLASATITGVLAPDDPTGSLRLASPTSPEPRFVH